MTQTDYKSTILLPKTAFPMKADLPKLEPRLLERWDEIGLLERQRRAAEGRPAFTFHDGPPYANGHIHIGHVLNKSLKDIIVRSHWMLGYDSVFVPGWDCHGLPIEWKIEEGYRAEGHSKSEVPPQEFRRACREFAERWVEVQTAEFRRIGVHADWADRWTTMDFAAEAQIIRELHRFLQSGALYRARIPVLWSPVEETALAEAEVEYEDRRYLSIYLQFPVVEAASADLAEASVLVWTTTPWTLPGNRCIAFSPTVDYVVAELVAPPPGAVPRPLLLAQALIPELETRLGALRVLRPVVAAELDGMVAAHPLRGRGYDHPVPLFPGDFVTAEQGSGFVHIAPSCGLDDYRLGSAFGMEVPDLLSPSGHYRDWVPLFAGVYVFDAEGPVVAEIRAAGAFLGEHWHEQRYAHSWRSHAPLVYRATSQWFISMSKTGLRDRALTAIDQEVGWVPTASRERIRAMVAQRPDWLVSRQRVWGAPLGLFVDRRTGEPLSDPAVTERIAKAVEREGAEAWFSRPATEFLGPAYDPADFEQVEDILDVWFDSGCSFAFSTEIRSGALFPASVVAEGTDQHRGYFQSGLLWSCGTRGFAPYHRVLTHGFVMDAEGRKMSKSVGNVVAPAEVLDRYGADILRFWVVSSDYTQDLRISPEILERQAEAYRKVRNTLRYLLGALAGYEPDEAPPLEAMPDLERWMLHRLATLGLKYETAIRALDFHEAFAVVSAFCQGELSSLYFDVRKDVLYCDAPTSLRRRATRTVLAATFDRVTTWLAPFLPFTADEAWCERYPDPYGSVHLQTFPATPSDWIDPNLEAAWRGRLSLRRQVLAALEAARRDHVIRSSLEAEVALTLPDTEAGAVDPEVLAELCLVSAVTVRLGPSPAIEVKPATSPKCARCWRFVADVGRNAAAEAVCARCSSALNRPGAWPLPLAETDR